MFVVVRETHGCGDLARLGLADRETCGSLIDCDSLICATRHNYRCISIYDNFELDLWPPSCWWLCSFVSFLLLFFIESCNSLLPDLFKLGQSPETERLIMTCHQELSFLSNIHGEDLVFAYFGLHTLLEYVLLGLFRIILGVVLSHQVLV